MSRIFNKAVSVEWCLL